MRLQQKAVLFTLPLVIIPTLILGLLSLSYTKSAQEQLERAALQEEVDHRADVIDSVVLSAKDSLIMLTNSTEFNNASLNWAMYENKDQLLNNLQPKIDAFFNSYPNVSAIKLFDNKRNLLHTFNKKGDVKKLQTNGLLRKYQDWFLVPTENRQSMALVNQSMWFLNAIEGHSELKSLGYIQVIEYPDWLELLDMGEFRKEPKQRRLLVLDQNANVIMGVPTQSLGSSIPTPLFNKLKASSLVHDSVEVNVESTILTFASRNLHNEYLLIFGSSPGNMLDYNLSYIWGAAITVLLTILFAPIILHYGFNKVIVARIERLANAKKQVAQGNLDIKLESRADDEIGDLFASFNVMVRQLIVYRENERDSRLQLEYKVKERTEELEQTNHALEKTNSELETAKVLSEQANELKSAFVANISHEIRTPLTAILGFTEQVLSTELHKPEQKDLLNRVLKSGRHLLALINDILDLSKIESNKLDLEYREFCLFQAIADAESILTAQAQAKGLYFKFEYDFPLPKNIRSDETRLKQILFNLISNAIKFTQSGGVSVKVNFDSRENLVSITVKDTGIGMTPEVQQRIFSPFVQADVSISRKFGGTGLGLVISKSLANLLGGDIKLSSEPGKGSEFTVTISVLGDSVPFDIELVENDQELQSVVNRLHQNDTTSTVNVSGRVLVAEDVEDNQHLFGLLLSSLKLDYVMVENGQKAVEKALTEDFDLILMDMQMPIMGGLEATKLIRQSGDSTPIYALTANVMSEDVGKHKEAGCSGTIGKPIDKAEFMAVLKRELGQKDAEEEVGLLPDDQMRELTESYLTQLMEQIAIIIGCQIPESLPTLKAECHKIKGSAGSYGFMELTDEAGRLEKMCEEALNNADAENAMGDFDLSQSELQDLVQHKEQLVNLANQTIADYRKQNQ